MTSRKDNEEPLKALVFADSCGAEAALGLLKHIELLNLPILSWQLGTLARHGVKEAIVLSSTPVEHMYEDPLGRMKVTTLSSSSWRGEGDAIRDLEGRDGMRPVDDFVLVRQGAVFNLNVEQLVAAHKRRKEADRNWLITTVFRKGAGSASTGLVMAVETSSGTLVKYTDGMREEGLSIDVLAENSRLSSGGRVEILSDVMDVGLDVCAPEFLVEFRENFYYDNVRAYIKEKLDGGEAEVFGNRMYAHCLRSCIGEYGTRIQSLASLVQATSDVLNGWMSPISAASISGTAGEDESSYMPTGFVVEKCAMGKDVSVGVGSTVVNSVIGNNVNVGCDVTINNSILMDNVKIGDGCAVERSVVGASCEVGVSTLLPNHTFLDANVRIGDCVDTLASHCFITLREEADFLKNEEDDDKDSGDGQEELATVANGSGTDTATEENWDLAVVGEDGKGRLIRSEIASRIDSFFIPRGHGNLEFESDEEDELEEQGDCEDGEDTVDGVRDSTNGGVSDITQGLHEADLADGLDDPDDVRIQKFNQETLETIERADAEGVDVDNTTLEVNSLKLVYHCSFAETLVGVVGGIALTVHKKSDPSSLYPMLDSTLERYKTLVSKFNREDDIAHLVQVAKGLADILRTKGTCLMYVFKVMYEKEMLDEDGILGWASVEKKRVSEGNVDDALLTALSPLLEWLEESEEDD